MGSPDPRQIDGMGGADPLTSKVAIVSRVGSRGVDVDYLFLQVFVDQAIVTDAQNCGNILAGVGPFAIERGLVAAQDGETRVGIFMVNTGQVAVATVQTPGGVVDYDGEARIDGVPGTAAPVPLEFRDTAGSSCGALLPTGNAADEIDGVACTLIDNGMPCVVFAAADVGATGYEDRETLDGNADLKARIEAIRLKAGPLMKLGDVTGKSVPKMMLVAPPRHGGAVTVRSLHPAPRPCLDRRARRGQRRHRLPDRRIAGGEGRQDSRGTAQDPVGRASDRRDDLRARGRRGRPGDERGDAAHCPQAHGRNGVRMNRTKTWMDNPSKPHFVPPPGAIDAHVHVFGPRRNSRSARRPSIIPRMRRPKCCSRFATISASRATSSSRRAATAPTTGRRSHAIAQSERHGARRRGGRSVHFRRWSCCTSHAGGIRGVRFNFLKRLVDDAPKDKFLDVARRIEPLGWHVVVYFEAEILDELRPFLDAIPTSSSSTIWAAPTSPRAPTARTCNAFRACSTSIPTSGPR